MLLLLGIFNIFYFFLGVLLCLCALKKVFIIIIVVVVVVACILPLVRSVILYFRLLIFVPFFTTSFFLPERTIKLYFLISLLLF